MGWTAISTQNPGIARKGGGSSAPFQDFFWRIWQCFPSQFLDNLTKTTGVLYGRGSAPCQDFSGGFGSHYKICCEHFEALFHANQYVNDLCVNIKPLSLPSICSLSTEKVYKSANYLMITFHYTVLIPF